LRDASTLKKPSSAKIPGADCRHIQKPVSFLSAPARKQGHVVPLSRKSGHQQEKAGDEEATQFPKFDEWASVGMQGKRPVFLANPPRHLRQPPERSKALSFSNFTAETQLWFPK
jgi:hypothetical protein